MAQTRTPVWPALLTAAMAAADACDLASASCNRLSGKQPPVVAAAADGPPAVTHALSAGDRGAFEQLFARALAATPAVAWATREFAARMRRLLEDGGALLGLSADEVLTGAFVTTKCDRRHAGYVGPELGAVRAALGSGNLRETWALAYVLTKGDFLTTLLSRLLEERPRVLRGRSRGKARRGAEEPHAAAASIESLQASFGLNVDALERRWAEIKATRSLNSSALRYAQGVVDFAFEPFNSWVRFDYEARAHGGERLWEAARVPRAAGCDTARLRSDDAEISPPLSAAELAYQCGDERPCALRWQPGALCFELPNVSWPVGEEALGGEGGAAARGGSVAGFSERARRIGYRTVAGVSGTTANVLQLATLLGFGSGERVALRSAMLGWMVGSYPVGAEDHSFFEVMLAADPFVPKRFRMAMGRHDLGRVFPAGQSIALGLHEIGGGGGVTYGAEEVWRAVGLELGGDAGARLLARMDAPSRAYVESLLMELPRDVPFSPKDLDGLDVVDDGPNRSGGHTELR